MSQSQSQSYGYAMEVGHKAYQILCVPVPEFELGLHNGTGTQSVPSPLCQLLRVRVRVTQPGQNTKCTSFVSLSQS